ncbi:ArsC family reductase [Shewanella sp.]|uniref:ArsC family reductase n=1 Tax=Shewanella sp. TaxID=50422 RepID=UPI004053D103
MTVTLFGIKNCDTVRKARKWLEAEQVTTQFHDFRDDGLTQMQLQSWVDTLGWEAVLNKRSTSFRALSDAQKSKLDSTSAIALMLEIPTLIKRPVLVQDDKVLLGLNAADYQAWFTK